MSSRKSFDNETLRAIGERLRLARGERTQMEFAKALGISRSALANYEAGRRVPNSSVFSQIERTTGISKRQIMFGSEYDEHTKSVIALEERIAGVLRSQDPGTIPKFLISDDELIILKALRGIASCTKVLDLLADELQGAVESDAQPTPVLIYEAQYIEPLRSFAKADYYRQGFDPDRIEWMIIRDNAQLAAKPGLHRRRPKDGPKSGPKSKR